MNIISRYDKVGRLIGQTFPGSVLHTYLYDANGNQTQVASPAGAITKAYDNANRLIQEVDGTTRTTTYSYDTDNRLTARIISTIGTFAYGLDNVGRQTMITSPQGALTTVTYDAGGRKIQEALPNGVVVSTSYDDASRITQVDSVSTLTLSSYSYLYNRAHMRTQVTDLFGTVTRYSYDDTYQITGVDRLASINWSDLTVSQWASLSADEWANMGIASTTSASNTIDAAGNATVIVSPVDGTTTLTYDNANRLSTRTTTAGITTYTRDGDNRLISVQVPGTALTASPTVLRTEFLRLHAKRLGWCESAEAIE